MNMNSDRWLLRKEEGDDCGITSVGGAAFSLANKIESSTVDWRLFPIREMLSRGWVAFESSVEKTEEELVAVFFDMVPNWERLCPLYRTTQMRSEKWIDPYSLAAWTARVVIKAQQENIKRHFQTDSIDLSLMTRIGKLSVRESGPKDAKTILSDYGIALVIEPHLPRTHLDGAALAAGEDRAVIGLTVRYDRIDNFWYSLMHELAHLALHVAHEGESHFFDDFNATAGIDPREREADDLAKEALIPQNKWEASPASLLPSKEAAELLAKQLDIHPAIVAGRVRFERTYTFLSQHVGQKGIRYQFPNIQWS